MTSYRWLIAGLVLATISPSRSGQERLSRTEMAEDLDQFFAVTRHAYAYLDEKKKQYGVDLERMQADAHKRLDAIKSNEDFGNLIMQVTAGLRDGHCQAYAGHLVGQKQRTWPFLLRSVKEGVLVTGIDYSVVGSGIEIGDLLLEVNGRAINDWIEEAARTVSASTDPARGRLALQRAMATTDASIQVTVQHLNGTKGIVAVKTGPRLRLPAEPNLADPPEGKYLIGRILKDDVGYIRIPSFAWESTARQQAKTVAELDASYESARDQIDAAFRAVAGTKALVLDLRGNPGGWDNIGAYVASHFLPGVFCYYTLQTRFSPELRLIDKSFSPPPDGWGAKWDWVPCKTTFSFFQGKVYTGRLVVLINEDAFSAADCLAASLADLYADVRFVGRPTHGGSGGPRVLARLKHCGIDVQLCTMRVWSPKGRMIEGHGTRPDVLVEWTREEVLKARDPDLEAALKDLRK